MSEHVVTVDIAKPILEESSGFNTIAIPGMFLLDSEGFAPIPGIVSFFPVPPGEEPILNSSVNAVENTDWSSTLSMAFLQLTGSGLESEEQVISAQFPAEHDPVTVEVIHLLGTTVAKVTVSPFCFGSPAKYASSITYSLSFEEAEGAKPIDGTLLEALCPDAEVWWPYTTQTLSSPFWGKPWARIKVKSTSFYSITVEELEASGCMISGVPSASLAMYSGNAEMFDITNPADEHTLETVSISVFDGGDGIFDQSDSLIFYGQDLWHWNFEADSLYRSYHRYDDANSYWLTWGGSNGSRITQASVLPSGGAEISEGISCFGFEEEIFWEVGEKRTGWIWSYLNGNYPSYFYLSVPFASELATVNLSMLHGGGSSIDHQVIAELDDQVILDTLYNSTPVEYFSIDSVSVMKGGNLLKVWNDHPNGAKFDFAEIILPINLSYSAGNRVLFCNYLPGTYSMSFGSVSLKSRLYDLTDPYNPVELIDWNLNGSEGEMSFTINSDCVVLSAVNPVNYLSVNSIEYASPGRLIASSNQADVIILAPEEFVSALSALEAVYSLRGLTVFIASYQEIYDEFNQGISDPGAVRSLVRWALDTWSNPPSAVVLIGDGSNDPLGYNTGFKTNAPVYITLETDRCLDSYFTIAHENGEAPELPVSRIPASNLEELLIAVGKASTLENSAVLGPWANRVLLAADDEWGVVLDEDESTIICEFLSDSIIPPEVNIEKLYEIEYPWPEGTSPGGVHPEKPEASSDFVADLNDGAAYVAFYGHGSYDQMSHEKLFSSGMVNQLFNAPRYFLFNAFSCSNGFFDLASGDCLSEILLFHPTGGAAATIACTRGSFAGRNKTLSGEFFSRIHTGEYTIAEAFWLSEITIDYFGNYLYALLGDGGITLPNAEIEGCLAMPLDTLRRGQVSSVDVTFPGGETTFQFRALESADSVTYISPLSEDFTIDYIRFGSEIYSTIASTDLSGDAQIDFFVPLQADTGSYARVDATARIEDSINTGYSWPESLIDDGNYIDDTEGPFIGLSFLNSQGSGEIPSVYQNSILHALLSDSSGICILGNDAGSSIIGSIDNGYEDLTDLFTYKQGSYTTGSLDYALPELLPGNHEIRVVARDGMKNTGESTLQFIVLEGSPPLLKNTGVYPNPTRGQRVFFFTTSSSGDVEINLYTVTGRPVWRGEMFVQDGANQFVWNGLDTDGDDLAAGAYIFVIKFSGSEGSTSVNDLLVVSP